MPSILVDLGSGCGLRDETGEILGDTVWSYVANSWYNADEKKALLPHRTTRRGFRSSRLVLGLKAQETAGQTPFKTAHGFA